MALNTEEIEKLQSVITNLLEFYDHVQPLTKGSEVNDTMKKNTATSLLALQEFKNRVRDVINFLSEYSSEDLKKLETVIHEQKYPESKYFQFNARGFVNFFDHDGGWLQNSNPGPLENAIQAAQDLIKERQNNKQSIEKEVDISRERSSSLDSELSAKSEKVIGELGEALQKRKTHKEDARRNKLQKNRDTQTSPSLLDPIRKLDAEITQGSETGLINQADLTRVIDLNDYNSFSPDKIVQENLISIAAKQGNLEAASSMINKILASPPVEGSEEALKQGLAGLIIGFPNIQDQAAKLRNDAFGEKRAIEIKYNKFHQLSENDPIIISAMGQLPSSKKRLASERKKENLAQAKEFLCKDEQKELREAEDKYQQEKEKATAVLDNFRSTITAITSSSINLTDFSAPPLDGHELASKSIIVESILQNIKSHETSTIIPKTQPNKETGRAKISETQAQKNLLADLPLSTETNQIINSYQALYSAGIETKILTNYNNKLTQIMDKMVQEKPESDRNEYAKNLRDWENEGVEYVKDRAKAMAETELSDEGKIFLAFKQNKIEAKKEIIGSVNADLVPSAIKLIQLNESLDDNDKIDPKNLVIYIAAALTSRLSKISDISRDDITTAKTKFSSLVNDDVNRSEYQCSSQDMPNTLESKKQKMKEYLAELGIKEEILVPKIIIEQVKKIGAQTSLKIDLSSAIKLPNRGGVAPIATH